MIVKQFKMKKNKKRFDYFFNKKWSTSTSMVDIATTIVWTTTREKIVFHPVGAEVH